MNPCQQLQAPLKDEERAELLFQRGMLYDSVGLSGLARYDFMQALELKPDMAEAHNSIGIHYIQQMDFIMAYESFDSTLDINPDVSIIVNNSGVLLLIDSLFLFHSLIERLVFINFNAFLYLPLLYKFSDIAYFKPESGFFIIFWYSLHEEKRRTKNINLKLYIIVLKNIVQK